MATNDHLRVDPDEVERFAHQLAKAEAEINAQFASLLSGFASLGQTWQDSQNARFAQTFKETTQKLREFSAETREVVPRLNTFVAKLRDAQNVRF